MAEEIPVHKIHKYAIVNCEKIIKGVCKYQWCWLAENPRTVCQRTPMDDWSNAEAYSWGQWDVLWWTQKGSGAVQGIQWNLSWSLCAIFLLVLLRHWYRHFSAWLSSCYSIAITTGRSNLLFPTWLVGFILGTTSPLTIGISAENQWACLFCSQSW